ncbi:hypothetical protein [Yinghuangia soli]|uniref:Uncharacterized protein n=1 Tax=Yinghuangia soli TaxID=2908204 RepID=A0AA41U3C2_9ACTN|nr:hypothetical protein [Yinghuangia soli]MCF2529532.1 hypothetical protein [Yinghuangia soli]
MLDYTQARAIVEAHLIDEFGPREGNPFVIHRVVPHRCGWEFMFQPLKWLEGTSTHVLRGAAVGVGHCTVTRHDASIEHTGVDWDFLAWHRAYDAATGEEPSWGRDCGC